MCSIIKIWDKRTFFFHMRILYHHIHDYILIFLMNTYYILLCMILFLNETSTKFLRIFLYSETRFLFLKKRNVCQTLKSLNILNYGPDNKFTTENTLTRVITSSNYYIPLNIPTYVIQLKTCWWKKITQNAFLKV